MIEDLDKKYYRIADVSEILGLNKSTLRFWESEFTELHPKRNAKGTRYYTPADIELLSIIKFLVKDKGLTLDGAREHLKHNRQQISRLKNAVERLQHVRTRLNKLIDALDARQKDFRALKFKKKSEL